VVTIECREHEAIDPSDLGQRRGDALRLDEVEPEPGGLPAELLRDVSRPFETPPRDDHVATGGDVMTGDLLAQPFRSSDDDDASLAHLASRSAGRMNIVDGFGVLDGVEGG
jgi:hypothetical protein